ncbi:hypothetical protein pb186bvf_012287 [Paramecium bursaria]
MQLVQNHMLKTLLNGKKKKTNLNNNYSRILNYQCKTYGKKFNIGLLILKQLELLTLNLIYLFETQMNMKWNRYIHFESDPQHLIQLVKNSSNKILSYFLNVLGHQIDIKSVQQFLKTRRISYIDKCFSSVIMIIQQSCEGTPN